MNKLFQYKQQSAAKLNPNSNFSPVSPSTEASSSQLLSFHKRGTSFSKFSSPVNHSNQNDDIIEIISSKEKDLIGADIRLMGYLKRSIDGILTSIDSPATRKSSVQKSFASLSPMSCFYDQVFDDSYDKAQNNPYNFPNSVKEYSSPSQGSSIKGQRVKPEIQHRRSWSAVPEVIDTKKNYHNEKLYENFETFSAYENEDFASKIMDSSHENGRKRYGKQKDFETSEESFSNRISFLENSRPKNYQERVYNPSLKNFMEKEKRNSQNVIDSGRSKQSLSGFNQRKKQGGTSSEYVFGQSPTSVSYKYNIGKESPMGMSPVRNIKFLSEEEKQGKNFERLKNISQKTVGTQNPNQFKEMIRDLDNMHFDLDKLREQRKQGNLVLEDAAVNLRKSLISFRNKVPSGY